MANITVVSDGAEQTYALESPSVTLGRGLESDIRLKDIKASRRHCQINRTPQGYQVSDLSSGNGTYLNGVQVKQQVLNNGDKIQIGSTTITFHSDAPAKTAAAPAQAVRPQTAAVARTPATTKSAARPATSQLPVAPTRKITAKVEAARPASQAIPKPKTQPIGKKSTRAIGKLGSSVIEKPRTTGIKKPTGRTGTARATATQKFHAEGRKKKTSPVSVIIGVIAAGLIIAVGYILIPKGPSNELLVDQLEILEREARVLDDQGKFDEAIAKYKEALAKIEGNDYFKSRAASYRATIKEIESDREALAEANRRFKKLQDDFGNAKGVDMHHELLKKAKQLQTDYQKSDIITWKNDLKGVIDRIEKYIATAGTKVRRLDFTVRRKEITSECNLSGDPNKALWGQAVASWNTYLGEDIADLSKTKATDEIRVINNRARDNFRSVKNRASRMVDSNRKVEAIDMLKREADRFKGTASEKDLESLLEGLDT